MRFIVLALLLTGCVTQDRFYSFKDNRLITNWEYSVNLSNYPDQNAAEITETLLTKKEIVCDRGWQTIYKHESKGRLVVKGGCL